MSKRTILASALSLGLAMAAADGSAPIEPLMVLRPAANASEYELLVYGDIGDSWWGESVTAKSVVEQLNALAPTVTQINIRINSYGGSVADGLAIYNALRRHGARKVATVDGVAMSSASLIAMAGDEVRMPEASMLMIHAPWGLAQGNANDMRTMAQILDTYAEAMAGAYARKSGKPKADMLALLTDGQDHYYTGEQAKDAGFADTLIDPTNEAAADDASAKALSSGLLDRFLCGTTAANAQFALAAALRGMKAPAQSGNQPPARPAPNEEETMRLKLRAQLRAPEGNGGGSAPAAGSPGGQPAPATTAPSEADVLARVRQRNDQIIAVLKPFAGRPGIAELQAQALQDPTMTVDQVNAKALVLLAADSGPARPEGARVEPGQDSRDKFVQGFGHMCVARVGLAKRDPANEFNAVGLKTLVRMTLQRAGVAGAFQLDGVQLADRVFAMHGTTDFPLLFANTANKILRAAYETSQPTWRAWCGRSTVPDFKQAKRIQLGSFNSLLLKLEGAEYKSRTLTEEAESIQAATKGGKIALTREMIINDDLGAFLRIAQALGFAAARTVNEDVYAFLAANAATSDTGALFNSTATSTAGGHANLASSSTAITVAAIGIGEAAMAVQRDPGRNTTLNLSPKFLLAPRGKRQLAWEVLNSPAEPSQANPSKRNYAASLGLELVSDAELDKASATAWYLAADPQQAALVEVVFLDGVGETPYTDEKINFDTDAMETKVRMDYGVGPGDWRGGFKNAGA